MKIVAIKADENLDRVRACPTSEVIVISSCRVFRFLGAVLRTRAARTARCWVPAEESICVERLTMCSITVPTGRYPRRTCRSARKGGVERGLNQRGPDPWFAAISKVQSEVSVGRDYCRPAARGFVGGRPRLALNGESRRGPSDSRPASADGQRHARSPPRRPSRSRPPACPVPRPRRWMTCPSPIAPCRRVRARC